MAENVQSGTNESWGPNVKPATGGEPPVSTAHAATSAPTSPAPHSNAPAAPSAAAGGAPLVPLPNRRAIYALVGLFVLAAACYFGVPLVILAFNTVSTDDAYVNSHVTFTAPRVPGQVVDVFVDDNYRVRGPRPGHPKGDLIVTLDKTPYKIIVDLKRAAYGVAKANLTVAQDEFRGMIGKARSARFQLQHTIEEVDDQVALLRSNVAKLVKADADYKRSLDLQKTPGVISAQQLDQDKAAYLVALEQVYENRVNLGLPAKPEHGELSDVPPDLDQTFSTVRQAVSNLYQAAAPLGIVVKSFNYTPRELIDAFYSLDPSHNVDVIYAHLTEKAPSIKLAESNVQQAKADLDQAELNLSYCDVYAEIDGVVTSRNVNPGNNVTAGQQLLAIRSLTEIWIDANFKETQLANLRIGQPAVLDVDMYGSHHLFKGHITGFTMGTGSTLALLPPENATGNFVKIVQRLPVRIELVDYDPNVLPLFVGLSVTPYVYYKKEPTGPNAGKFLQELASEASPGLVQSAKPKIEPPPDKENTGSPPSGGKTESVPPTAPESGKPREAAKPPEKAPSIRPAKQEKTPPAASGTGAKPEKKP